MLISPATQKAIRVILTEKKLSLRELAKTAGLSLGIASRVCKELIKTGYLKKRAGLQLLQEKKLLRAWAYVVSVEENKKIEFMAAERPQYLIQKIARLLSPRTYAFTLFSATELLAPYVSPDKVHLYIDEKEGEEIKKIFLENQILPAERGNIICYLAEKEVFYGGKTIRGVKVVSLPQLYVDLSSYGPRGEEAAEELWRAKNV